ncbi:uncharacterized protein LOC143250402 isoform X1 [Tachypleus tridentatus]|uniref:uncharacterized protein LOC143250402 isoform X1 n=1 Tax=Tachypleus tridentatus TaxID=6853 RepID=UPI003FD25453
MKTTTISYSLLISSLLVQVLSLPERILLGGLFDIGDDEEEFAFRLAVDRTNADINILARSTVVAHMERLDRYDNFRATKKEKTKRKRPTSRVDVKQVSVLFSERSFSVQTDTCIWTDDTDCFATFLPVFDIQRQCYSSGVS